MQRTNNPIRRVVDGIKRPENHAKEIIPLALGDPTVFGNFHTPTTLVNAVIAGLHSQKYNGYCPSVGLPQARRAIAKYCSTATSPLGVDDVIIASGCSGALEIAIKGLLSPGDNMLLPRPGFALYQTIAEHYGSECKFYDLIAERDWEADLVQMEQHFIR
jgi:tyrosine aminotransferase